MEFVAEQSGERLDKFLVSHLTKFSRSRFKRFIKDGAIRVNGKEADKPGLSLKKGDRVLILEEQILSPNKEYIIDPEADIPLNIIYEDDDILVINKQSGLIIHPTLSQKRHTLVNALVARYPDIIRVGESPLRPGIVHRLDKDTSGLIVVAKNQEAFFFLKKQFLSRAVQKTYLAIVEGVPREKEGVIKFQIRPSKLNRLKKVAVRQLDMSGRKSVRAAETQYRVKEEFGEGFALMEVWPKTGRTHQIRVHLSAVGHPVVGDSLYGVRKKIILPAGVQLPQTGQAKRQMLHAYRISFVALNGKLLNLKAPLPEDMRSLLDLLRKNKT